MHRLGLDIDPVAYVRNVMEDSLPDPIHSVVLGEMGGAESIVCYLRDDQKTVLDRDVALLRQTVKSYLNIRSNLTEETIRKLLRVKPDMITFVAPGAVSGIAPAPLDLEMYSSQLNNYIAELRSNNILSSVLIEPDINQVKIASKIELDYIEFYAMHYSEAEDMNAEIEALEHLSGLTLGASKMGLGVNISGGLNYNNIREITHIDYIEDIVIGKPILTKALLIGFEQAVRDLISQF
jgi:pyridoxine 5-phosphate synthase